MGCPGGKYILGSLSTRFFETRTATGSELFSPLTCLHTTTFTSLSIFSPLEMISIKIWETPLPWQAKSSLPVAVRLSKTRVLKLPINLPPEHPIMSSETIEIKMAAVSAKRSFGYHLFRLRISNYRELKQRQRRWQRELHKFAYIVGKNNTLARPAGAFFTFVHFLAVVSKTT